MTNNRNVWVDYLRSFITVLVVAHHATLAYTTFARFDADVYIRSTNPIVDAKRSVGLDIFENFNDIFFMSLMFLIGGLFLSKSVVNKGTLNFILDRTYRLFIPFLTLGTLFMLIAYFPAYYMASHQTDILAYVKDFFTVQHWPVGPPWFIWVLFVFNVIAALINPVIQKIKPKSNTLINNLQNKPLLLFIVLLCLTWILYVPISYNIGAGTWTGWGPFDFQLNRVFLYFGYFLIGILIGNTDFNQGIFSSHARVVKSWWVWVLFSLIVYAALTIGAEMLAQMVKEHQLKEFHGWMIYYTLYVSSCVLSCLAFITTFRKFTINRISWWDALAENAYLIYLVHYIFIVWMQFLLLDYNIPAFLKFAITFIVSLALSCWVSVLLRRIPLIKRYI